jgi:hypothetical protein
VLAAVRDDLVLGGRGVVGDDVGAHRLAGLGSGTPITPASTDARQRGDALLDLVGVDVEAADQDHVLLAVDDPEVAVSSISAMSPVCSQPSRSVSSVSSGRCQ